MLQKREKKIFHSEFILNCLGCVSYQPRHYFRLLDDRYILNRLAEQRKIEINSSTLNYNFYETPPTRQLLVSFHFCCFWPQPFDPMTSLGFAAAQLSQLVIPQLEQLLQLTASGRQHGDLFGLLDNQLAQLVLLCLGRQTARRCRRCRCW